MAKKMPWTFWINYIHWAIILLQWENEMGFAFDLSEPVMRSTYRRVRLTEYMGSTAMRRK